jgi:hypothetical protein
MPDPGTAPVPAEYGAIQPGEPRPAVAPGLRRSRTVAGDPAMQQRGARRQALREGTRPDTVGDDRVPPAPRPPKPPGRRARRLAESIELDGVRQPLPKKRWRREKVRVVRGRRSRRIVRRIDTWTVLKVSLIFYLCTLVVVIASGVALWNLAEAFGFLHSIEKSIKTLFDYTTFTLHPIPILEYTCAFGAGLAIVGTLGNVLIALLYNLISDLVGGIQIVVIAEEE